MADVNRAVTLKRVREIKALADAAFWQLLDLRILLDKVHADLTAAEVSNADPRSGILGEDENHEDYQPGDSENGQCS